MAKAKSSERPKRFLWRNVAIAGIGVLAVLILVAQVALDVHFWRVDRYTSGEPITSIIIESVEALHKPAVIEPVSKKVYLPDANLVLPPQPATMPNLLYTYTPSFDSVDAEADVTVTNAVSVGVSKLRDAEGQGLVNRDSSTLFTAVPGLQVCSRGLHVVFGTKTKYDHLLSSKTLADGRTMDVYSEKTACAYDLTPLANYLAQAQSY